MSLAGRVALVTGSSRGIGRAIAERLADEGASVVLNAATSIRQAQKIAKGLSTSKSQRHLAIRADIREPAAVRPMMRRIRDKYGRIDILVNNAGTTRFIEHERLDRLTLNIFDDIYAVHVRGAFLCTQHALPLLQNGTDPLVINIASIASVTAIGSNIAYCAMKAAMVNMTKSLARALAPTIRVNAISPGLTQTPLIAGQAWKAYRKQQLRSTPLHRLGQGVDVANAVISLATSLSYTTGHNLVVDGGRLLN
jgi:3-oxoacyl-[acyl-carrier protein] reductase